MDISIKIRFLTILLAIWIITSSYGCHKIANDEDVSKEAVTIEYKSDKFHVEEGQGYVGSEACKSCHQSEFRDWSDSKHSKSFNSLKKIEMDKDPSCLRCHTTGFGKETGFTSFEGTSNLASVGCECCHGPALEHVNSKKEGKKGTIYYINSECKRCEFLKYCIGCHNIANDPGFEFNKAIKEIDHKR
jgi:hypothetical protein